MGPASFRFLLLLLQLEVTIISGLDNLVIAKVIGVEAVALYSVAARIISLAFSLVYSLGASFWGGVSNAMGTGDLGWIRSEAARSRQVGSLWMAVFAGGFAAVGAPVIALWTGGRLRVDPLLPVALGTYFALLGHTMIDASILNGAERIRQQLATVGCDAIIEPDSEYLVGPRSWGTSAWPGERSSLTRPAPSSHAVLLLEDRGRRRTSSVLDPRAVGHGRSGGLGFPHQSGGHPALERARPRDPGGRCVLGLTLLVIRLIVGPRGLEVLRGTLRRARHHDEPGRQTA